VAKVAVAARGEGGLMGIALDPRFSENRRFFLYYTHREGSRSANRLAAWILSADGRSAHEEKVLLDGIAAEKFHDGGRVRVGPDGLLYLGTGDAGRPELARDRTSPNGKILRITPGGAIPSDNPIAGNPAFVLGLRNVQAFDWLDPRTLIVADHGPSGELGRTGHDRVVVVHAGDDVGWPEAWGCTAAPGTIVPLLAWVEAVPPGGGAIYRGTAVPGWRGSFLVGTLRSRHLHRVILDPDGHLAAHEIYLEGDPPRGLGRLREVVQGPDGALWVTTSNCDGRGRCPDEKDVIARIVAR
jgi:glucose/arabinose dehydrogenase